MTFKQFKETLIEYEIEHGFGKIEKKMKVHYLPRKVRGLGMIFNHRDKRKAFKEFKTRLS